MIAIPFQNYLAEAIAPVQVYWGRPQQSGVLPYVTFFVVSTSPLFTLSGQAPLTQYAVQVDTWANNLADVQSITGRIAAALDYQHDLTWTGNLQVQGVFLENRIEHTPEDYGLGTAQRYYRVQTDYKVWCSIAD